MNILTKYFLTFFTTVTLVSSLAVPAVAQRDIGPGYIKGTRETIPVVVRSRDSNALNILKLAFSAHGKYRLVNSMQEASFAIQIDPIGSSHSALRITSGVPEQQLHSANAQGTSTRNSILKAVDMAIRKTSGLEGFFGGKIAYVGEVGRSMEIYWRDFLFGEGVKLTNHNVEAIRPRWSPDGNYIVYTSYYSGFPNIRRIDLRGQRSEAIVSLQGTNTSARYSPDGSRMAMVLTGRGNADIYVGNSQAKALSAIVKSRHLESAPCWSPNGREIVFVSDSSGGNQLYRGSATGGSYNRIPTNISGACMEPDWNPKNPDQIAFTIARGNGFQIADYSFSQRKSATLTNESGHALQPCWLNDGRHMLYTLRNGATERIVLLDTVSGKRTILSPASLGKVSQASFLPPRG
ncbi:MAG: biopolymer transporter Tol [Opitutales bacterium]|jgi:TolB protein|nr:biopolymer transporter Tol [Opitutales bacterium]MDG2254393.1 biopolymer transporter Tol [Opitutaceae bacterium]MBT5168812.1 biopolymer transporter Tol [Opitutales bacterium]MBT5814671.1 biopolymer transporter Tol [Opitutales bacterium]MBT6378930.1 biopolymer transporter Tol [Opitutales bacterium]